METRLTQIGTSFRTSKYRRSAVFKCSCGNNTIVDISNFRSKAVRSCGCLSSETTAARNRSHGMSNTSEYEIWCGIIKRCKSHERYAGRGLTVSGEWGSFENFYRDMGPRPSNLHSVERKDNDRGYCRENCVWATATVQNRNTRRNTVLHAFGKAQCLQDWADELRMNRATLRSRIFVHKWDVEKALTTPIRRKVHDN